MTKWESIHFHHGEVVYVPCFQKNPRTEKDGYPCFTYSFSDATLDPEMAASLKPDYILVLRGEFDAKTQPFDLGIVGYNLTSRTEVHPVPSDDGASTPQS